MRLEVLVTTMHQSDLSKYTMMNLQTDAVIANQTDRNEYFESMIDEHTVKMISTNTIGTSRNKNIAIAHASQSADIFLFSDDDLVFNDGYEQLVVQEFERHPEAEAIKFNLHDLSKTRKISMRRIDRFEKATRRNMSASGVCGGAIKQSVFIRHNLKFREDFGPGTPDYKGEDTIFLMEMLNKKVKFYRSPVDIAGIDQTISSWYRGYDKKFFIITGKVFAATFPRLCYALSIRSAFRFFKKGNHNMKFSEILKCYFDGISDYVSRGVLSSTQIYSIYARCSA